MLRPRLRPTLSLKVKYWGVALKAQKKLGREARRDLRKLIGHANFLDVLVSELDISGDEDKAVSLVQKQSSAAPDELKDEDLATDSDDDDSTSEDGWREYNDRSEDEDHTLVRTVSGRPSTSAMNIVEEETNNTEPMKTTGEGYFSFGSPGSPGLTIRDALVLGKAIVADEEHKRTLLSVWRL